MRWCSVCVDINAYKVWSISTEHLALLLRLCWMLSSYSEVLDLGRFATIVYHLSTQQYFKLLCFQHIHIYGICKTLSFNWKWDFIAQKRQNLPHMKHNNFYNSMSVWCFVISLFLFFFSFMIQTLTLLLLGNRVRKLCAGNIVLRWYIRNCHVCASKHYVNLSFPIFNN